MRFIELKRILSYIFIIPEFRFESELSGAMDIRWEDGRLALNSQNANYSYNQLHKVMQKGMATALEHGIPSGRILNLGMGAGSTVSIIREEMGLVHEVISVEFDPLIIEVAKEYFDVNRFSDHQIILDDAFEFVQSTKGQYALIIIDLFKDKKVDDGFLSKGFVERCKSLLLNEGTILFNYIGSKTEVLKSLFSDGEIKILTLQENQVLIYRKTERS